MEASVRQVQTDGAILCDRKPTRHFLFIQANEDLLSPRVSLIAAVREGYFYIAEVSRHKEYEQLRLKSSTGVLTNFDEFESCLKPLDDTEHVANLQYPQEWTVRSLCQMFLALCSAGD